MTRPQTPRPPNEKRLRLVSFAIHATRGLLRDQNARRKAMFAVVLVALVMLFAGATVLTALLDPRAHPGWFISYWFFCAWITMLAILLAVFDLLLVRSQERAERRRLNDEFTK
jgi:protein-S-isoprenylcysteine O-methyltransferase Ste14